MTGDSLRPADRIMKDLLHALNREYIVIGHKRVSSLIAWTVIAFLLGVTITIAFLASRTAQFEEIGAATPQQLAAGEIFGAKRYKDGLIAGASRYGVTVPQ